MVENALECKVRGAELLLISDFYEKFFLDFPSIKEKLATKQRSIQILEEILEDNIKEEERS